MRNLGVVLATRRAREHSRIVAAIWFHSNALVSEAILSVGTLLVIVTVFAGCGNGSASGTTGGVPDPQDAGKFVRIAVRLLSR
jgi:hypothetical protein